MSSKLHTFWLIAALAKRRKRGVETVWGMGGHLSSLSCGSRSTPLHTEQHARQEDTPPPLA